MNRFVLLAAGWVSFLTAGAQTTPKPFPEGVFKAKTIAIVNDTRQPGVEKGADQALTSWGQFKVVDDPQLADVVLRFEKTTHREGHGNHKTDSDQSSSVGYEFSVNSTISMKVFYKDAEDPFYFTKTEDGKNKAGTSCIDAFHTAWRTAVGQAAHP